MTSEELLRHLESLLFVAAEPAEIAQLASALDVKANEVAAALDDLAERCQSRGIRVQRKGQHVALASAPEASPFVEKFLGLTATTRLSQAALETLAIIAYRQPITRAAIEALRGVDCDGVLRTLTARQLIEEVERLDTVGHPIRYGTTFEFLRYFGLQNLDALPPLQSSEQKIDDPKVSDVPSQEATQSETPTDEATTAVAAATSNDDSAGEAVAATDAPQPQ